MTETAAAGAAKVAAVVLAAGRSRRMGETNKLLAAIEGAPMIRRAVERIAASQADPIVVVTGYESEKIRATLAGCAVAFAHNDDYAQGLSTSLRRGLAALGEEADGIAGAVICLGDMPLLKAEHIDALIAAFHGHRGEKICVPVFHGRQGNPVLWPRRFFAAMRGLSGDRGAKGLIAENRAAVVEVAIDDPGIVEDVDTPAALSRLQDR